MTAGVRIFTTAAFVIFITLPSWIYDVSQSTAVRIWLVVAAAFMLLIAVELAGIELPGWRTISSAARRNWLVRIAVALLFILGLIWWWIHSGHA